MKLCDFGVAEEIDPFSTTDMVKGSQGAPMFQAPEIATGQDFFSGTKLDVWSAGVSLYNFVTGEDRELSLFKYDIIILQILIMLKPLNLPGEH